jgi:hypothetical protein
MRLTEKQREWAGALAFVATAALGAVIWNHVYVQPREAFLHDVMECVGEDTSEEAWSTCAKQMQAEREG